MGRVARAISDFFRLAFWPLAVSVLVVLLLQPIYFLSLTSLGHLTSRGRTVAHLNAAFDSGVLADDGAPRSLVFKGGEQLTECISLGIGLDPAETPVQTAITGAYPMAGDTHACEGLHHAVTGAPTSWQPYFRYWHGYRIILAPLASAFPLWFVKVINALMVAAACALLWLTLRRYRGAAVATIFLLTFVCLSDVLFIWRTSSHSLSLAYILAGASLFAAWLQKDWTPSRLIVLAAVLGSGFNFIDFLINPPMMPMLMAFFVLLSRRRDAGLLAFATVIAWFAGYAETWAAKWALAYAAMPASAGVVGDIVSTIEVRTVGALDGVYLFPLAATARTFLRALNRGGVIVPLIILAAVAHYAATVSRIDWRGALWLSTPALVAAVWFEALSSHSQFHLTVSSRSAAMALAILLSAAVISMQRRPSLGELWAQLQMLKAKLPRLRPKRAGDPEA
jgi:hypothetical protein